MKILLLNILEGCEEPERFQKLVSFINKEKADVLCLLELNNWHKNEFKKLHNFKTLTQFSNHSFAYSNKGYHLGIFTKEQVIKQQRYNDNFNHGFLKCVVLYNEEEYTFFLTHLTPHSYIKRKKEISTILQQVKHERKTILLGDLNALSPEDNYDKQQLHKMLREKNIEKFGIEKISTQTIQKILDNKFLDTIKSKKEINHTVPTSMNSDDNHCAKLRLDYIFVNKKLHNQVENVEIIKNMETNKLSDHFPIKLTLN